MIIPYQSGLIPAGHFDFKDTELSSIKGGEIVVFDDDVSSSDEYTQDVYARTDRSVLRKATSRDAGPFFFVDTELNKGTASYIHLENSSLLSSASPTITPANASGKLSLWGMEGFYAVTTDVTDGSITTSTEPNSRLYVDDDGKITTTPSQTAALIGYFIEFREKEVVSEFPVRFQVAGTNIENDTIIINKVNADGYLNLAVSSIQQAIGSQSTIGTPTDGYFSDGYVSNFTSSTTIADAVDNLNEALLDVSNAVENKTDWQVVESISERNSIPTGYREEGMRVRVSDLDATFELVGGTSDGYWTAVEKSNYNYIAPSSTVTMYVETWGDDGYGDGSAGNPFRQPQRALDSIPNGAVGDFIIQCGVGTFEAPYFRNEPGSGTLRIFIVGSRDSIDVNLSSPSYSDVSGKEAQMTANVGAYGATITDGSHWLEYTKDSLVRGGVVRASTSPNLVIVKNNFQTSYPDQVAVHPYETIFESSSTESTTGASSEAFANNYNLNYHTFMFVGVDFNIPSIAIFSNCHLDGCRVQNYCELRNSQGRSIYEGAVRINTTSRYNVSLDVVDIGGVANSLELHGINTMVVRALVTTNTLFGSQIFLLNSCIGNLSASTAGFSKIDFEGSVDCIIANDSFLGHFNDWSIAGSPPTFMTLHNSTYKRFTGVVNGSVTGDAVTLEDGSQAIDISTAANGNLTSTGGDEIVIGGLGGFNFSDLPKSDFGLGPTAQGCRAT